MVGPTGNDIPVIAVWHCLLALVTETCVRKIINWLVAVGEWVREVKRGKFLGNKMYLFDLKGSEYYH